MSLIQFTNQAGSERRIRLIKRGSNKSDIGQPYGAIFDTAEAVGFCLAGTGVLPPLPASALAMSSDGNTIYRQLTSNTSQVKMQTVTRTTETDPWIVTYTSDVLDQVDYASQWTLRNNEQNLIVLSANKVEVWVKDGDSNFTSKMDIDPTVLNRDVGGTATPRSFARIEMSGDGNWLALVGENDDATAAKGFILERSGNSWVYRGEVLQTASDMNITAIYFSPSVSGIAVIEEQTGLGTSPAFARGYSLVSGVPQLPSDWTANGDFQDLPGPGNIPANYIDGSAMFAYGTTFYKRSWNVGGITFDEVNKTLTASAIWPLVLPDTDGTRKISTAAILFDGERSLIAGIGHPTDIDAEGAKLMLYHSNGDGTFTLVNDLATSGIPLPQLEYSSVLFAAGSNKFAYITNTSTGSVTIYGKVEGTTVSFDGELP